MNTQINLTEQEQRVLNAISKSELDYDNEPCMCLAQIVTYTIFTFTEAMNLLKSLEVKEAIKIRYDYNGNTFYFIN
jgi:hypothetical protein